MKRKLDSVLIVSIVFFVVTICIFGPLEIYIANQSELWFSFSHVLMVSGVMSIAAIVILGGIGMLLKGKWQHIYSAALFCVTLCLYLQGNYLNINYGTLDGFEVRWDNYDTYAVLNTASWLFVAALCVVLFKKKNEIFRQIQMYASAFIVAVQILTLGVLLFTGVVFAPKGDGEYYLSMENMHSIGSDGNIVVLLLDAFDEAYIEELFIEDPERYGSVFQDFTHYTNVVAGGTTTNAALPVIITGKSYPGGITFSEYIDTAFNSDKLYTELKKQEYSVNIYTESMYVTSDADEYVDNIVNDKYRLAAPMGFIQKYGKLTLYKYMPHLLKRYFWLYTGDFNVYKKGNNDGYAPYQFDDIEFYRILAEEGLQKTEGKQFSILHTNGAHPPHEMNEFAQRQDGVTVMQQCKGQLLMVEEYLNQMKELGVYDNSTVIVMADHGQRNRTRGVLMIKRPYAKGYIKNDAPISHFDLHDTFFELLGVEKEESIFDIQEDAVRMRRCYSYGSRDGVLYVTESVVNGNPKDEGTVTDTGVVLTPSAEARQYQYGEKLGFGMDGSGNRFVEKGMDTNGQGYGWTNGNEIVFRLDMAKKPKKDLTLELTYYTVYLEINDQYLGIYVDDQLLFEEVLTEPDKRTITVDIPKELAKDRELVIRLDLPDAKSPAQYLKGEGLDGRILGLALTGLCIQ